MTVKTSRPSVLGRVVTVWAVLTVALCAYCAAGADGGWKLYFFALGLINARVAVRGARRWSQP